ncbi:hypothetical protein Tco_0189563 [Tanacetum coccineum]
MSTNKAFQVLSLLSTENTTARGDSMMEDDQDDLAEGADSGLQSHWDTGTTSSIHLCSCTSSSRPKSDNLSSPSS